MEVQASSEAPTREAVRAVVPAASDALKVAVRLFAVSTLGVFASSSVAWPQLIKAAAASRSAARVSVRAVEVFAAAQSLA